MLGPYDEACDDWLVFWRLFYFFSEDLAVFCLWLISRSIFGGSGIWTTVESAFLYGGNWGLNGLSGISFEFNDVGVGLFWV